MARPTHFPADLSAETRGRRTGRAEGLLVRKGEAALGGGVTHLPPGDCPAPTLHFWAVEGPARRHVRINGHSHPGQTGGQRVSYLLKTTLPRWGRPGSTQEVHRRVPGPACREPGPVETPSPQG